MVKREREEERGKCEGEEGGGKREEGRGKGEANINQERQGQELG